MTHAGTIHRVVENVNLKPFVGSTNVTTKIYGRRHEFFFLWQPLIAMTLYENMGLDKTLLTIFFIISALIEPIRPLKKGTQPLTTVNIDLEYKAVLY